MSAPTNFKHRPLPNVNNALYSVMYILWCSGELRGSQVAFSPNCLFTVTVPSKTTNPYGTGWVVGRFAWLVNYVGRFNQVLNQMHDGSLK